MDLVIKHADIAKIGYYFLNPEDEKKYLDSLNYELLHRIRELSKEEAFSSKRKEVSKNPYEESYDLIFRNIEGSEEIMRQIRKELLLEERNLRKYRLLGVEQ